MTRKQEKKNPLEFECLLGGDGEADAEGVMELQPGPYNHLEMVVWETKDGQQPEHDGRYNTILTRKSALAMADAIREYYGVKPDETAPAASDQGQAEAGS
jgi:hypothetical protein